MNTICLTLAFFHKIALFTFGILITNIDIHRLQNPLGFELVRYVNRYNIQPEVYFSPQSVSMLRLCLRFATFRNISPLCGHRTLRAQSGTLCKSHDTLRSKRPESDRKLDTSTWLPVVTYHTAIRFKTLKYEILILNCST